MGAKCTTTLAAGVSDDWAALVQQARDSDVLCSTPLVGGKCTDPAP
jgi:hypothetical protein